MTKADWLDFFEAINGRSATEEEIAAALAAGEFQDDAPAVETAPTQEAPAQPASLMFKKHQPKRRNHSQLSLVPRSATTADFCECTRRAIASSFCKCSGSTTSINLCGRSNCSSTRSTKSSGATTSWFCQCSSWSTSSFC